MTASVTPTVDTARPPGAQAAQARRLRIGLAPAPRAGTQEILLEAADAATFRRGLPVPDGACAALRLDLPRLEGPALRAALREARRLLAPTGRLRLPWPVDAAVVRSVGLVALPDGTLGRPPVAARDVTVVLHAPTPEAIAGALAQEGAQVLVDGPVPEGLDTPRLEAGTLEDATTDVVIPVGPHEVLGPHAAERLRATLAAHPSAAVAAAWRPVVDLSGEVRATPRLGFEDVRVDGAGLAALSFAVGLDLLAGTCTVAFRRAALGEGPPAEALGDVARGLAALGRGDAVVLCDPVSVIRHLPRRDPATVRADRRGLEDWARAEGLLEPGLPPLLRPRRLRQRPWWSATARAAWGRRFVAPDPPARLEALLALASESDGAGPNIEALEGLLAQGRDDEAARLGVEAVRRRPDVAALSVLTARALDRVGLVDDARFLLTAAAEDGVVLVGPAGRDPRREPIRIDGSWAGWISTGGVPASLVLTLHAEADGALLVSLDGEPRGEVALEAGERVEVGLDLDTEALGQLLRLGPEAPPCVLVEARIQLQA